MNFSSPAGNPINQHPLLNGAEKSIILVTDSTRRQILSMLAGALGMLTIPATQF